MGKEGEKKNNDHNKKNYYDDRIKRKEKTFMFSLFKVTKSHQKAMSQVRTIVYWSKYYQNDFRF